MLIDEKKLAAFYRKHAQRVAAARQALGRPLTLAEKILASHAFDGSPLELSGEYGYFRPDRLDMQDVTAQMALLQLLSAGIRRAQVDAAIHCDHLIKVDRDPKADVDRAWKENAEVYEFLIRAARRFGIGFWQPGSGIIHQTVLENHAFPGGLMIGTDSHTPNAAGLGMLAIGAGGADALDALAGLPWELKIPKRLGVRLTGQLRGWAAPKDIILKLTGELTVRGGTGYIVEYFGPGAKSLSCTGKATIGNMGAEIGATTSIFAYDASMEAYLRRTDRAAVAELANQHAADLQADPEVLADPAAHFDRVIEIDLDRLTPHINGPFTPDRAHAVADFAQAVRDNDWPRRVSSALIGSCTNSSYEDIERVVSILDAAAAKGIHLKTDLLVSPGSARTRETLRRDGQLAALEKHGARILASACGPCVAQWNRTDATRDGKNSIVTSFNRNFGGRTDGNPLTHTFLASPETVVAYALAGDLGIDFTQTGGLPDPQGLALPEKGFVSEISGYLAPTEGEGDEEVLVDPKSERLEAFRPFPAPQLPGDYRDLRLLAKVAGKCTTDHICMAGPWFRFRGHLKNISGNFLIRATNALTGSVGETRHVDTGEVAPIPKIARDYQENGKPWIVVAEHNYGEGSSREHAALEPRFLGGKAIIAKSFARIHETNLKKQGVLALTFVDENDYDVIHPEARYDLDVESLTPGRLMTLTVRREGEAPRAIALKHTLNENQIGWFRAGSALALARQRFITP